jgi:hypothetical protein
MGTGTDGYGQSLTSIDATNSTIQTATFWNNLRIDLAKCRGHQTGNNELLNLLEPVSTTPSAGQVQVISEAVRDQYDTMADACVTNKRVVASGQGSPEAIANGVGTRSTAWKVKITHSVTTAFTSSLAARYFFNAGGLIRWQTSKTADATDADTEWNDLASTLVGSIYLSGSGSTKSIAGVSYNGTTKIGGTGSPTILASGTGAYNLTGSPTNLYRQFADTGPYTGQYINLSATNDGTNITFTTTWVDDGGSAVGSSDNISGGTATTGATFGTAPATLVTVYPPSTTYLANSWGSTSVAASVA